MRRRRRSISSLLAIRLLLIGNGCTLTVVGVLFLLFAERPGGLIVGGLLTTFAAALFACVPLTDPYRHER